MYFLAAYFLITCSEYKNKDWKIIFFILPFIHTWIPQFFSLGLAQSVEEILALIILSVLAFMSPLRSCHSSIKQPSWRPFLKTELVDLLPVAVTVMLLFILFFIDVIKTHDMRLLVSLLPMGFFILLAIKKIPLFWITVISLLCLAALKRLAIPAIVPVGLLVLLQLIAKPYPVEKNSLS